MRSIGLVIGVVLAVLAVPVLPGAVGQEPPEVPEPPETPEPVGDVSVELSVAPSGTAVPPDGTVGQAMLTVTVTCTAVVVLTRPVEVALAYTERGAATDVSFDPPVINFTSELPACPEGTSAEFDSVVSFRLDPVDVFRARVPMRVEASSANLPEAVEVEWEEEMGFAGTASASIEPRIPVKTDVNNQIEVRIKNDANAGIEYRVQAEGHFPLAEDVFVEGARVAPSPLEARDGIDYHVVEFVPEVEGDAALLLRVTFMDPRDGTSVLREQLVSATIVSDPAHDQSRAPERGGAPGPGGLLGVWVLVGLAALLRRRA